MKRFLKYTTLKYLFLLLLIIALLGAFFYSQSHPSTNNAYIRAKLTPISPSVAGRITGIFVKNNDYVKKGQRIIQLDPTYYKIQYQIALGKVALAKEKINTLNEALKKAQDAIIVANVELEKAKAKYARERTLLTENAASKVAAQNAKQQLLIAQANLNSATTDKLLLTQSLKPNGSAYLDLKNANNMLQLAKYNLDQTTVYAKNNGYIANLNQTVGSYIDSGMVLAL